MVSTVGLSSARHSGAPLACYLGTSSACRSGAPLACCSRTFIARCWGISSPPIDCSSAHVLRGGAFVLGGGATGTSLSSDHSNTAVLHGRVVWSPPSEMPPGLRGAAPAVFLFFQAGSSVAALFP